MHLCYLNNCDGPVLSNRWNYCDISDIYGDECDIYVTSHVYSDEM